MKVEGKKDSVLEMARAGIKGQVHNERVTHVLLNDQRWYKIIPGSFRIYQTEKNVPFIQFDTVDYGIAAWEDTSRIEIFPSSLCAVRYVAEEAAPRPEAVGKAP